MGYTTSGRNAILDGGLTAFTHVSAYSDLGTTEVASSRVAVSWNAAASGVRDNTAQLSIPIPAAGTAVVVSVHSASSAGNLQGWFPIGTTVRGVATVATSDTLTSNGHGLSADDRVFFQQVMGESLPTGLSASTLYFVRSSGLTTDTFTVSTTSGGAAVDVTAVGEVAWFRTVPNTFASGGNVVIAAGALDLDLNAV